MDRAIDVALAPWAQYGVVGAVVVALSLICWQLWKKLTKTQEAHLAEVRACAASSLDLAMKKIESDNKLASALEGLERVVEAAMGIKK